MRILVIAAVLNAVGFGVGLGQDDWGWLTITNLLLMVLCGFLALMDDRA